jgi:enamine deaminase RidA (YjgF/YER057c/UK114 family)
MAVAGSGLAQDAGPPPEHDPKEPPRSDVEIPMKARANISLADMQAQITVYFRKMDEILKEMTQLADVARRQKDVIKLNCVLDKQLQLKELRNIAEQAASNMNEAASRGDDDGRYHEFGRVTISAQQAEVLNSEAQNCIGEELTFLGPTTVDVLEPDLPEDPTLITGPDFPVVEPLPVASPQR